MERTIPVLFALLILAVGVVVAGALLASDRTADRSSDRWLISGPHSYH